MVPIPVPVSIAIEMGQVADALKEWRDQANDAKSKADAQLLTQASLLVIAMNAYSNGYLRLIGEFQDFRPSWGQERRRNAEEKFRAWIDPRDITDGMRQHLTVLIEMSSEREKLDKLISDAESLFSCTVEPLLNAKESSVDRARVIDALTSAYTMEQARDVTRWAEDAKKRLAMGEEQRKSANKEMARLTARLTELHRFTQMPKTPWYRRLVRGSAGDNG
jgi:hypothetical protein